MQDTSGAGRRFADLHQLYQRTRQVRMAHQERPIYALHWEPIPPRTLQVLLTLRRIPGLHKNRIGPSCSGVKAPLYAPFL